MNEGLLQKLRRAWQADLFSPKDFLRRALLICVVFLVAHLAGLREFTSVLNGTTGSTELSWEVSAALGVTYIFFYLAFVLLVPALMLAAAILAVWRKLARHDSIPTP